MTTLVAAIILIGIIVFIHELGHYLAARSIGVKVERFSETVFFLGGIL